MHQARLDERREQQQRMQAKSKNSLVVMRYKATLRPGSGTVHYSHEYKHEVVGVLKKLSDYLGASALTPISVQRGSVILTDVVLTFLADDSSAMKIFNVMKEQNGVDQQEQLSEAIGFEVLGVVLNGHVLFGSVDAAAC